MPHRQETRGVGGIFFDYLKPTSDDHKNQVFGFVKAVGETFAPTYTALMKKNADIPYSEEEKQWQLVRRGRYLEFNLVWDRGTKFGPVSYTHLDVYKRQSNMISPVCSVCLN